MSAVQMLGKNPMSKNEITTRVRSCYFKQMTNHHYGQSAHREKRMNRNRVSDRAIIPNDKCARNLAIRRRS